MSVLPVAPLGLVLGGAAALLALVIAAGLADRRRRGRVATRAWLRRAGLVLLLGAIALRPGVPGGTAPLGTVDVDVYFVVDTTSSIAAEDFGSGRPRLDGVRADIVALTAAFPGARYALLTFDAAAVQRMPLTSDATAAVTAAAVLRPEITTISTGTSTGRAAPLLSRTLAAGAARNPERAQVVFYFGDGGQTDPESPTAYTSAHVSGGAVLGYGTPEGGRMLERTGYEDDSVPGAGTQPAGEEPVYIQDVRTAPPTDAIARLDATHLTAIAHQLGVPYVHRTAGAPIAQALTGLSPGELRPAGEDASTRTELYWALAVALLALLGWEAAALAPALADVRPRREVRR